MGARVGPLEVKDIFDEAREAKLDLDGMEARQLRIESSSMSSGIPQAVQGGKSDPTAKAGQALAELHDQRRETEALLRERIERARALIEGVRRAFKPKDRSIRVGRVRVADILEDYYLNGLAWKQVAALNDVGKATALRVRDMAFEWISFVGVEKAIEGEGVAEDGR